MNVAAPTADQACAILADFSLGHWSIFALNAIQTRLFYVEVEDVRIESDSTNYCVNHHDQRSCVFKARLWALDDALIEKFIDELNAALGFALGRVR